ncbi:MAG TPA: hypothetical protein VKU80_07165, partial [Planctomycetota bacterium]|nr:hypothetical protein [Planctomycetota bacterium]
PYSREEFPDPTCAGRTLKFGEAVKKGLKWLLEEQGEDGTFRSGVSSFDQVLGALALTEAYGSTTSTSLKDPAQHALDAMAQLQKGDGSWGGAGPTAWALQALSTGDQSELTFPREAQNRAVQVALGMEHPANLFSLMVVTESRGFSAPAAVGLASAPPDLGDYLGWYYASRGLVQFEGPQGPLWTAWRGPLEAALVRQQTRDGSWTGGTASGTGVRSSLASMILQVCHGYFR